MAALLGCAPPCPQEGTPPAPRPGTDRPNVLVLVIDDVGIDQIGAYGVHPTPNLTPALDALSEEAMLFEAAVAHPVCSPSRASLLTGQEPADHGVGGAVHEDVDAPAVDPEGPSLPRALPEAYTSWALGKWHLAPAVPAFARHPNDFGFDHYAGAPGNLLERTLWDGSGEQGWHRFDKVIDGESSVVEDYATADTVADVTSALRELPEPWFLYVGLHAAHFPFHTPPEDWVHDPSEPSEARQMAQSADVAVGRILDAMEPEQVDNTYVIVLSDNGSSDAAVVSPWLPTRAKGTGFRGGIAMPLLVRGPGIESQRVGQLVQISDLYSTILDLTGSNAPRPDGSWSVAGTLLGEETIERESVTARKFVQRRDGGEDDLKVVRTRTHKLITNHDAVVGFFDLSVDPMEQTDLSAKSPALQRCLTEQLPP